MRGRRLSCSLLALLVILLVVPLSGDAQQRPLRLVIGVESEPPTLDRMGTGLTGPPPGGPAILEAVFDALVMPNPSKGGQVEPRLATSWRLLNNTTWQLKLRERVKFQNGEDLDAQAVKFSIELALAAPAGTYIRGRTAAIERIEVVDRYTVNIITKTPFPHLPGSSLAELHIYPPRAYREAGSERFGLAPVGAGRFRLREWKKGVSMTLVANPSFWGEKASFDELEFRFIPDAATRIAALEAGEVDAIINVPPDEAKRLEGRGFTIATSPIGQGMLVHMQAEPSTPLADKRVRQALNYAVNKEALVRHLLLGYTRVLPGQLVHNDGFGHNPQLRAFPYDPARARRLLAEAGYPNGFVTTMDTTQGRYVKSKELAEAIAGQLQNVGVTVRVDVIEWGDFISRLIGRTKRAPLTYVGFNYYPAMDADWTYQWWAMGSGYKLFNSQTYDEAFYASRQEMNSEKRLAFLRKVAAIAYEEAPGIFLFQSFDVFAISKKVQGLKPMADNTIHLDGVKVGR